MTSVLFVGKSTAESRLYSIAKRVKFRFELIAMLRIRSIYFFFFSAACLCGLDAALAQNLKLAFWDEQRKGANGGGEDGSADWFAAARSFGIEYVRLSPTSMESDSRDFLIGDADAFEGIPEGDLAQLIDVLDRANEADIKIELTTFSLPGCRWRQHNDGEFDYRIWNDETYQDQAVAFWRELATALKDHPAMVGYNIVNEPHPEREGGFQSGFTDGFEKWRAKNEGGLADLNLFYTKVIEAIRDVDTGTPIVLDSRYHANAKGFASLDPVDDEAILYSFHCYEPWIFSTYRVNKDRFAYPDRMPGESGDATVSWTLDDLAARLRPVSDWAEHNGIPANRILMGEFGCDRKVAGAERYLSDLIGLANEANWHWAFYSFRASGWDGMNYELGTEKLNWKQWEAIEKGSSAYSDFILESDNSLWSVLEKQFSRD